MWLKYILILAVATTGHSHPSKCDQTPPDAKNKEPRGENHPFKLDIGNAMKKGGRILYTPSQTYVLSLTSTEPNRSFRWFMITAEDPDIENAVFVARPKDVGSLKSLDISVSRHSERCANSVENFDNSAKPRVEIHWVSPEKTSKVRIRAMVAENDETWYEGYNLNMTLEKEEAQALDSSPNPPNLDCKICSEARYEVIFNGKWSRVGHPRHYPKKPDDNGYTHMIGASHDVEYYLWKAGSKASEGLKVLLEDANTTVLEREIINSMNVSSGTRTMIRGKRRHHPHMFEPSHSLFRVDNVHHMFSIVVGMRPSPDWFLGMTQFELCVKNSDGGDQWLEYGEIPLFPWDAGTRSGVSYESESTPSQDNIVRVEVGSFNKDSPFYQMNLNDLHPFAQLEVRRLDVYALDKSLCPGEEETDAEHAEPEESPLGEQPYPMVGESRQRLEPCVPGEWGDWSECVPDVGDCGLGAKARTRLPRFDGGAGSLFNDGSCQDEHSTEFKHCYVEC